MKVVRLSLVALAVATPALADPPKVQLNPPPPVAPPNLPDPVIRMLPKTKGGPGAFKASAEVMKIASDRIAAAKKTLRPISSGESPASITIAPGAPRPSGASLYFQKPLSILFADSPPTSATVYLPYTWANTFDEGTEVGEVQVDFKVEPGNMYVADCPLGGVNTGHYRLKTLNLGPGTTRGSWITRQTTNLTTNFAITWIADRAALVRIELQGWTPREDGSWTFDGCRVTTIPYS